MQNEDIVDLKERMMLLGQIDAGAVSVAASSPVPYRNACTRAGADGCLALDEA